MIASEMRHAGEWLSVRVPQGIRCTPAVLGKLWRFGFVHLLAFGSSGSFQGSQGVVVGGVPPVFGGQAWTREALSLLETPSASMLPAKRQCA